MRPLLLFASLLLLLALPATATAVVKTDSSGKVTASLSYTEGAGPGLRATNLKLTIQRKGKVAYRRALRVKGCTPEPYCVPSGKKPVLVRNLDRNREPEVLVTVFSGGAHCCTFLRVLRYSGGRYKSMTHNFKDPGYRLRDLNGDKRPELVSADARFAFVFASFASSGMPIQIWSYRSGKLKDRTRKFRRQIRRDARNWWKGWKARYRQPPRSEALGQIAAWAGDQYLLGHRRQALKKLRSLAKKKKLPGSATFSPGNKRFVKKLDRFLRRRGY